MQTIIAVKIHNNSLGQMFQVSSFEQGVKEIKNWAAEQFGRPLTDFEIEGAEQSYEIYNDDDPDNVFCFSLGVLG